MRRSLLVLPMLVLTLACLLATAAPSAADVIGGSSLQGEPNVTKEPTGGEVDTVYWLATLPGGSSAAMTVAGTVHSVTIKGYALTSGLLQTILIQVLRPQPNGSLLSSRRASRSRCR
jgi:ABC-type oligopeptide transport system substrate-binding subunit